MEDDARDQAIRDVVSELPAEELWAVTRDGIPLSAE
jgi:hypothetical protein